jgi:hypothetical protein
MPILSVLVTDSKSQAPVSYVSVKVDSTLGVTDTQGIARFNVVAGQHALAVNSHYYRPVSGMINVQNDETYQVKFERAIMT